jgi:hypothetical protein
VTAAQVGRELGCQFGAGILHSAARLGLGLGLDGTRACFPPTALPNEAI